MDERLYIVDCYYWGHFRMSQCPPNVPLNVPLMSPGTKTGDKFKGSNHHLKQWLISKGTIRGHCRDKKRWWGTLRDIPLRDVRRTPEVFHSA
jgi:hypothetical protein